MSKKEVYSELLEFSRSRPKWQQDALRRIVQSAVITEVDIEEISQLCRSEFGLFSSLPSLNPIPLNESHLHDSNSCDSKVTLERIADVLNVNLLANGQALTFQQSGLTVVYGHNGSGKSGYARILRCVTRSRGKKPAILPNGFSKDSRVPSAKITFLRGDVPLEHVWVSDNDEANEALSRISFFDSDCAGVYVDHRNEPAFTPFGLDVLPKLADICSSVQKKLKAEKATLELNKPTSLKNWDASRKTRVTEALGKITADTNLTEYSQLSVVGDEDQKKLANLRVLLAQDNSAALKQIEIRLRRIVDLQTAMATIRNTFDTSKYSTRWNELATAKIASEIAARNFSVKEELPIGSGVWKSLWDSARSYSTSEAYRELPFPFVGDESKCVLCFQPLEENAKERMSRFESFVRDDSQKKYDLAETLWNAERVKLQSLRIEKERRGTSIEELALDSSEIAGLVKRFFVQAQLRRRQLLRNGESAISLSPIDELEEARQELEKLKSQLENATSGNEAIQKEIFELEDRNQLARIIDDVEAEIKRLGEMRRIDASIQSTNTLAITRVGSELTEKYINESVRSRFLQEIKSVGVRRLPLKLESVAGSAGTKLWQVKIDGLQNTMVAKANISQILSQGEQRGLSLAAYLSELQMEDTNSALVFDDPVSSLDHRTRRSIANRLAEEAQRRQVIVFTHDTVFMLLLEESCTSLGVEISMKQVSRNLEEAGICSSDVPWAAKGVSERVSWLRNELQRVGKIFRQGDEAAYEREAAWLYVKLRDSWERGAEEVLLNGSVVRFGRSVQTQRLKVITDLTGDDVETLEEGMKKCSNYAHDEAQAINAEMPDPDEFAMDIDKLDEWVKAIRARRSKRK